MAYLSMVPQVGKPLEWEDSLPYLNYVREHGVLQFLEIYKKLKDTHRTELKWGEELEYGIIMVSASEYVSSREPPPSLMISGAPAMC